MQRTYVEIVNARPVGYLTISEYAAKRGVSEPAVRQYITRKKITSLKIGQEHWIHEDMEPIRIRKKYKKRGEQHET